MTKPAEEYFIKAILHLLVLYPYLASTFNDDIINILAKEHSALKTSIDTLYKIGVRYRNYDAASYALYFVLKCNFKISEIDIEQVLESENTIFMTLAYLYAQRNGLNNFFNELFAYAQKVNKKDADFDRILEKYKNLNISNERMKFIKKYLLKKVEILKDIVKGGELK